MNEGLISLTQCLCRFTAPEENVRYSDLVQLSNLLPLELQEFQAVWPDIEVERRRQIVARLIEMGEDQVELDFRVVFEHGLEDPDPDVREKSVEGLWECDDRVLIRPLVRLLRRDKDAKVRAGAALALGKYAQYAQEGKLPRRDQERLQKALLGTINELDESSDVRGRAIEAIAAFCAPWVGSIIEAAYRSEESILQGSAIHAMGQNGDRCWLPIITKELENPDPEIRFEAANACAKMGEESTVPRLSDLVVDDDDQVRISAIQALGAIGGSLAKKCLMRCVEDGDELVKEQASHALVVIDDWEAPMGLEMASDFLAFPRPTDLN